MRIPFGIQTYQHPARQAVNSRLQNCYVEPLPKGSKAPLAIIGTPGISTWATVGSGTLRGAKYWREWLWVLSGETLYRTDGTTTTTVGTIPGTDRVSMAAGEYLAICSHGNVYWTEGGAPKRVDDPDFKGASKVAWLAGYYIYVKPGTGVFYISAAGDPSSVDALDFATAEAQPDKTVSVLTDSTQIIFFGEESTEVWALRGGAFPFVRNYGGVLDIGCLAPESAAKLGNIAFWLAHDRTVWMLSGGAKKISTEGIDHELANLTNPADAIGMTSSVSGRGSYILTFPTDGRTFEYSVNTGLWNERKSFGYDRWRGDLTLTAFGKPLVLDAYSSVIGVQDTDVHTEFGTQLVFRAASAPVSEGNRWLFHNSLYLDFETGRSTVYDNPEVMIRWSDDGYNWQPQLTRSMGNAGQYSERISINQTLGRAKNRIYEVAISDPVYRHFLGAEGDIQLGGY